MGKGDKKTRRGKIFRGSYGRSRLKKKKRKIQNSKSKICYMSKKKFTRENMSLEHIIPNALGGRLKSYHLINAEWNGKFGATIDAQLVKQIPLPTLLNIKRDKGRIPKIKAETEDGIGYIIGENLEVKRRGAPPKKTILPSGLKKYEFVEGQEESVLREIKKDHPNIEISIDELRNQIKWDNGPRSQLVYFDNHLNIITGEDAYKAICKIACNYYVFSTNDISQIQQSVPFLEGTDKGLGKVRYYYPKNEAHKLAEGEISHLIHIVGNKKERLLYAYVELFNCHSFLVILNDDYEGKDINHTYCYDVNNNTVLDKKVNMKLTKEEIAKISFPVDKDTENEYFKRLQKTGKIKGLDIEVKT